MLAADCEANELSGNVSVEYNYFLDSPLHPGQKSNHGILSFSLQPEYYHEWEGGSNFIFVPFVRWDQFDSERSHFDIRELNYQYVNDLFEFRLGIGKVFWGVTEFVHLVDVINQTDLVEDIDTETKLGQPMLQLSLSRDWGMLDLFVLPGFRERTFPGTEGRLRPSLVIDSDEATYESGAEEKHIDFAARYSCILGELEFGIDHFHGTNREPTLLPARDENGRMFLAPHYDQIDQTGIDLVYVVGQWILKAEAIYRTGQTPEDFFSSVTGFEYELAGIEKSKINLNLVAEYAYDERGDDATTPFQNDLIGGFRITANDFADSQLLVGYGSDLFNSSNYLRIEASRRIGESFKASLESMIFFFISEKDAFYDFRDDDYIRVNLAYFF